MKSLLFLTFLILTLKSEEEVPNLEEGIENID